MKKESLPLGDGSDCIAGNSKWSSNSTQITASPITDILAVAHWKNNPNTTKTAAKSAQEIPIGAKIIQCQPGMSGMSILQGILSMNDRPAHIMLKTLPIILLRISQNFHLLFFCA